MFENYVLSSGAICAVINQIEGFRTTKIPEAEIQAFIEAHRKNKIYFCGQTLPVDDSKWIQEIDGARLLKDLFKSLSENRVTYDKVRHAPLLTEWLIQNAPVELEELATFLFAVLS